MDPGLSAWILKGVISCVIVSLGFAMRTLFGRVRAAESEIAVLQNRPAPTDAAGREAKGELQTFKLCVAENYIRRGDYIPQMSQLNHKVDAIGVMVARIDERNRIAERFEDQRRAS